MITINLDNAEPVNLVVRRGNTFVLGNIRFWTDAAHTIPKDISGYSFAMEWKDADGAVIVEFEPSDFVVSDTNLLTITKGAADMLIPATSNAPYKYDLEQTDDDDVVSTIMAGNVKVNQDITNA